MWRRFTTRYVPFTPPCNELMSFRVVKGVDSPNVLVPGVGRSRSFPARMGRARLKMRGRECVPESDRGAHDCYCDCPWREGGGYHSRGLGGRGFLNVVKGTSSLVCFRACIRILFFAVVGWPLLGSCFFFLLGLGYVVLFWDDSNRLHARSCLYHWADRTLLILRVTTHRPSSDCDTVFISYLTPEGVDCRPRPTYMGVAREKRRRSRCAATNRCSARTATPPSKRSSRRTASSSMPTTMRPPGRVHLSLRPP